MSLRLRLLVTLVPLFIVGLVLANVGTYVSIQNYLLARVDQEIFAAHNSVGNYLTGQTSSHFPDGGGAPGGATFPDGTYGRLESADGTLIKEQTFGYGTLSAARPDLPEGLRPGTQQAPNLLTVSGSEGVPSYRVYVDTSTDGNILIVALPLNDVIATLNQLLVLELVIGGGVTLVLALATVLAVRRSLRPLVRMGETARAIAPGNLHQRIQPATEKTEVGRLGLALNAMLAQLEAAFADRARSEERLRHFVSDASHELRTPLTSMRGYAELLRRNQLMDREQIETAAGRIEDESRRLGVLVDDLLLLARLDQGRELQRERVDLEALVSDACADARVADPGRAITARAAAPLVVTGDEGRLRQVLGNLVRNALVHTAAGTPIEVSLRPEGLNAVIDVVDHGPGVPAEAADRIFERFHRADPEMSRDRGGSGLGLSIATAVVAVHGGRLSLHETPGGGATFRIELPLPEAG